MLQEYYRELPYTLHQETHSRFTRGSFCRARIQSRIAGRLHFPVTSSLLQPGSSLQSFLDLNDCDSFSRVQASHFVVCLSVWVHALLLMIRPRLCILGPALRRGGAAFSFHFIRPPRCRFVLLLVVVAWVAW